MENMLFETETILDKDFSERLMKAQSRILLKPGIFISIGVLIISSIGLIITLDAPLVMVGSIFLILAVTIIVSILLANSKNKRNFYKKWDNTNNRLEYSYKFFGDHINITVTSEKVKSNNILKYESFESVTKDKKSNILFLWDQKITYFPIDLNNFYRTDDIINIFENRNNKALKKYKE